MLPLNPFIYGRPVPVDRHIDREAELRTIFSRIHNKESTAIIGEPQTGKTSLIRYLLSDEIMKKWLRDDGYDQVLIPIEMDAYLGWLSTNRQPGDFWRYILDEIRRQVKDEKLLDLIKSLNLRQFESELLNIFFIELGRSGKRVLLVIDEFDSLIEHPNLTKSDFFGVLRSLATRSDGIQLITSSITSVADMNECSRKINPGGSPYFNYLIPVNLKLFDRKSIDDLVDSALMDEDVRFDLIDREFIAAMSGGHPFRLQAACAALYEVIASQKEGDEKYEFAARRFLETTHDHYLQLWKRLDDPSRTTLLILVVLHYKGLVLGKSYSFGEIENSRKFEPYLHKLCAAGLVEKVGPEKPVQFDPETFLVWRGQSYRLSYEGVAFWLTEAIVSQTQGIPNFDTWLQDQQVVLGGLLTKKQLEAVKAWISKAPKALGSGLSRVFIEFLKGFTNK